MVEEPGQNARHKRNTYLQHKVNETLLFPHKSAPLPTHDAKLSRHGGVPLSTEQEVAFVQQHQQRMRMNRILQVRAQEMVFASQRVDEFRERKMKDKNKLLNHLKEVWRDEQRRRIASLAEEFVSSCQSIGLSYDAALLVECNRAAKDELLAWQVEESHCWDILRSQEALQKARAEKESRERKQRAPEVRRKMVESVSNIERSLAHRYSQCNNQKRQEISTGSCHQTTASAVDVGNHFIYSRASGIPTDFKDTHLHSCFCVLRDCTNRSSAVVMNQSNKEEMNAWRAADAQRKSNRCTKAHQSEQEEVNNERKLERGHAAAAKLLNGQRIALLEQEVEEALQRDEKHSQDQFHGLQALRQQQQQHVQSAGHDKCTAVCDKITNTSRRLSCPASIYQGNLNRRYISPSKKFNMAAIMDQTELKTVTSGNADHVTGEEEELPSSSSSSSVMRKERKNGVNNGEFQEVESQMEQGQLGERETRQLHQYDFLRGSGESKCVRSSVVGGGGMINGGPCLNSSVPIKPDTVVFEPLVSKSLPHSPTTTHTAKWDNRSSSPRRASYDHDHHPHSQATLKNHDDIEASDSMAKVMTKTMFPHKPHKAASHDDQERNLEKAHCVKRTLLGGLETIQGKSCQPEFEGQTFSARRPQSAKREIRGIVSKEEAYRQIDANGKLPGGSTPSHLYCDTGRTTTTEDGIHVAGKSELPGVQQHVLNHHHHHPRRIADQFQNHHMKSDFGDISKSRIESRESTRHRPPFLSSGSNPQKRRQTCQTGAAAGGGGRGGKPSTGSFQFSSESDIAAANAVRASIIASVKENIKDGVYNSEKLNLYSPPQERIRTRPATAAATFGCLRSTTNRLETIDNSRKETRSPGGHRSAASDGGGGGHSTSFKGQLQAVEAVYGRLRRANEWLHGKFSCQVDCENADHKRVHDQLQDVRLRSRAGEHKEILHSAKRRPHQAEINKPKSIDQPSVDGHVPRGHQVDESALQVFGGRIGAMEKVCLRKNELQQKSLIREQAKSKKHDPRAVWKSYDERDTITLRSRKDNILGCRTNTSCRPAACGQSEPCSPSHRMEDLSPEIRRSCCRHTCHNEDKADSSVECRHCRHRQLQEATLQKEHHHHHPQKLHVQEKSCRTASIFRRSPAQRHEGAASHCNGTQHDAVVHNATGNVTSLHHHHIAKATVVLEKSTNNTGRKSVSRSFQSPEVFSRINKRKRSQSNCCLCDKSSLSPIHSPTATERDDSATRSLIEKCQRRPSSQSCQIVCVERMSPEKKNMTGAGMTLIRDKLPTRRAAAGNVAGKFSNSSSSLSSASCKDHLGQTFRVESLEALKQANEMAAELAVVQPEPLVEEVSKFPCQERKQDKPLNLSKSPAASRFKAAPDHVMKTRAKYSFQQKLEQGSHKHIIIPSDSMAVSKSEAASKSVLNHDDSRVACKLLQSVDPVNATNKTAAVHSSSPYDGHSRTFLTSCTKSPKVTVTDDVSPTVQHHVKLYGTRKSPHESSRSMERNHGPVAAAVGSTTTMATKPSCCPWEAQSLDFVLGSLSEQMRELDRRLHKVTTPSPPHCTSRSSSPVHHHHRDSSHLAPHGMWSSCYQNYCTRSSNTADLQDRIPVQSHFKVCSSSSLVSSVGSSPERIYDVSNHSSSSPGTSSNTGEPDHSRCHKQVGYKKSFGCSNETAISQQQPVGRRMYIDDLKTLLCEICNDDASPSSRAISKSPPVKCCNNQTFQKDSNCNVDKVQQSPSAKRPAEFMRARSRQVKENTKTKTGFQPQVISTTTSSGSLKDSSVMMMQLSHSSPGELSGSSMPVSDMGWASHLVVPNESSKRSRDQRLEEMTEQQPVEKRVNNVSGCNVEAAEEAQLQPAESPLWGQERSPISPGDWRRVGLTSAEADEQMLISMSIDFSPWSTDRLPDIDNNTLETTRQGAIASAISQQQCS